MCRHDPFYVHVTYVKHFADYFCIWGVGTATRLRAGLSGVPISPGANYFYLLRNIHIGSAAHFAFYSMGTWLFIGGKAAGTLSRNITST